MRGIFAFPACAIHAVRLLVTDGWSAWPLRGLVIVGAVTGLAVAGCAGDGADQNGSRLTHPDEAEPTPAGVIAFSHGFEDDIFAISPVLGSEIRRLTKIRGPQFDPSWSPNGRRIVFRDSRAGVNKNDEIYVMNGDGSRVRNLTRNSANDWSPAWSPDGRKIVFASTRGNGQLSLWIMRADGTGAARLTTGTDEYPSWSPKGDWIAFGHGLPQSDIWVVRPDGSEGHALADSLEPEWLPAWSPSGEKIVFVRGYEGQTTLWIMNADGSGQRQLTRIHGDMSPAWAPDGSRLVFVRNGSLYLMDPSGEHVQSLQVEGVLPSWGKG